MMLNKDPAEKSQLAHFDRWEGRGISLIRYMNEILYYDAFLASLETMTRQ